MIQKLFFGLTLFILIIIGTIYGALFTKPGNNFVAGYIQNTANSKNSGANLLINDFTLTTSTINFDATINDKSFIKVNGDVNIIAKTFDLKFEVDVQDLSTLKNLTNQQLNGSIKTNGTVIGDAALTTVMGNIKVAKGSGEYDVKLVDFNPSNILLDIKDLKLDELLYMVNQPKYAKGNLNIDANIKSADIKNLDGIVNTTITNGLVNNPLVNKSFELKLKDALSFKTTSITTLKGQKAISKAFVNTTPANIEIKEAIYDLGDMKLNSDYKVIVEDFANLYDLSQTKMRGKAVINGDIEQSATILKVTGNSNILGGSLNYELLNDNFKASTNGIELKEATYMMYYPKVFDSKANLNLDYNLAKKTGKLNGTFVNGYFLPNEFSTLLNQLAKFDLTKEVYESVDVKSDINDKIIKSVINMKSKNTKIDVTSSTLDLNKSNIDADITANILKYTIGIDVSGNMTKPNVKFDTGDLLKSKAKDEVNRFIDKNIKNEDTKKIINNFKTLFN